MFHAIDYLFNTPIDVDSRLVKKRSFFYQTMTNGEEFRNYVPLLILINLGLMLAPEIYELDKNKSNDRLRSPKISFHDYEPDKLKHRHRKSVAICDLSRPPRQRHTLDDTLLVVPFAINRSRECRRHRRFYGRFVDSPAIVYPRRSPLFSPHRSLLPFFSSLRTTRAACFVHPRLPPLPPSHVGAPLINCRGSLATASTSGEVNPLGDR